MSRRARTKAKAPRLPIKAGDVVDASRYNAWPLARHRVKVPSVVMDVIHDDDNPYYTRGLLECDEGTVWLGVSWIKY